MSWGQLIAGGVGLAAGLVGQATNEPPAPATVDTKKYFKNPVAEQLAKDQLATAERLAAEANDPRIAEAIYSLLPADSMGPKDFAKYNDQFTKIKKGVTDFALRESEKMAGATLESLVERGVISSDQAERQKIQNRAKTDAIANIAKKRLTAQEHQMERDAFIRGGAEGLKTAGVLAREKFNKLGSSIEHEDAARKYELAKEYGRSELETTLAGRNAEMSMGISGQRFADMLNLGTTAVGIGTDVWKDYKQSQTEKAFVDKYPEFGKYFEAKGLFS